MPCSMLSDNLRDLGLTYKLLHKCVAEQDKPCRQAWREYAQANWVSSQLVFVDETSKDDCTVYCHYGRSISGTCADVHKPLCHGQHYSIVAALAVDGYINQHAVEKSVDGKIFTDFIINEVVYLT